MFLYVTGVPVSRVKFSRTRRNGSASGPAQGPTTVTGAAVGLNGGSMWDRNWVEPESDPREVVTTSPRRALRGPAVPRPRATAATAGCRRLNASRAVDT